MLKIVEITFLLVDLIGFGLVLMLLKQMGVL